MRRRPDHPGHGPAAGLSGVTLYTQVDLPDDELADQAVALLTGTRGDPGCQLCHGLAPGIVSAWGAATVVCFGRISDVVCYANRLLGIREHCRLDCRGRFAACTCPLPRSIPFVYRNNA